LFAGVGAFVLWLSTRIGPNFRFDGDISMLYSVGFGGIGIGIAIVVLFWRLVASQATVALHQNGIHASGPDGQCVTLYRDIEDVFVFFHGGLGFRATPQSPWTFVGARNSKYAQLSSRLIELQIQHRGVVVFSDLQAGKTVAFRYLQDSVAQSKSFVASRRMDFPMSELSLSRDTLQIAGKSIAIARIDGINTNLWTEKSQIIDTDGQVFHTVHPSSVFSFALLHEMIARLQRK
jgi:hypothetical protein